MSGILDNMITENIDAIRVYFDQTPVMTPEAQRIKDAFVIWYDDLTWFGKGLNSNYDLARNQRNPVTNQPRVYQKKYSAAASRCASATAPWDNNQPRAAS